MMTSMFRLDSLLFLFFEGESLEQFLGFFGCDALLKLAWRWRLRPAIKSSAVSSKSAGFTLMPAIVVNFGDERE